MAVEKGCWERLLGKSAEKGLVSVGGMLGGGRLTSHVHMQTRMIYDS